jgi:hypothetical protein
VVLACHYRHSSSVVYVQRALALTLAATISAAKVWRKSSSYTYDKCKEALEAAGLREPALTAAEAGVKPSAGPRSR